ncbi:MAG: PhoH family protein [Crocinitomicaceae bacterium TMED114]|nr:MAG: PhoH family protein [Crocinitomicaceae bacterium TMED114]
MASERRFTLPDMMPLEFFGVGHRKFATLKSHFPKLKLVGRGNEVKAMGAKDDLDVFAAKWELLMWHMERYGKLEEDDMEHLIREDGAAIRKSASDDDTLVYGPGGLRVTARTPNQRKLVEAVRKNDMVFAIGPAGSGKTYTAVALAVQALKEKRVRRIIMTRPAVEAGENLGFLPGDLKEKLDPYMQPLYDALTDMLPYDRVADHLEKGVIEIAPLAFMRGRTLDKAFVILDEAQNATVAQMKMFLTRMGKSATFIVTGDASQVDLPRKQESGLRFARRVLRGVEGLSFVELTGADVVRHALVKRVIEAFETEESKGNEGGMGPSIGAVPPKKWHREETSNEEDDHNAPDIAAPES